MGFIKDIGSRFFGITDSDEEVEDLDQEEDDEEDEDDGERRSFTEILKGVFNRKYEDDPDEDEQDEVVTGSSRTVPPPVQVRDGNIIKDSRLVNVEPEPHCERIVRVRQIDECRDIIQFLLDGESVLLNLENVDPKDCGRIVDLLSGAAFALSGRIIKVAHLSYLLAPQNVNVIEMNGYGMNNQSRFR
ncbi:MAG: cell division protein SepF [Clostridia bacterium]|nr:cell division protein SepF [Clostridia bacterium]